MKPRLRHRVEYALLRAVTFVLGLIPLGGARRVGEWLGLLGFRPLGIRRQTVERQLAAAFPGLSPAAITALARAAYKHLGRVAIELALLPSLKLEGIDALFDGLGDLGTVEALRAQHKAVVAFTGHIGNWELAGAFLAMHGVPLDAVVRRMANPLFDGFLTRTRSRTGMRVVYDKDAVRAITRGLKEGRVPGLVADQGVLGLASVYVPFFGRPAKTPRGPAVFAIRFDAPIVFCSAILQANGRYRFVAEEIPVSRTGNMDEDVERTVAHFTAALERLVRRYPEQYFWHHRRWKRQPADTPVALRDPVAQAHLT